MSGGLDAALQGEFRRWQELGRGVAEWDCPVLPEPYFYPFLPHGTLVERPAQRDDGRRETALSRLGNLLSPNWMRRSPPLPDVPPPPFLTPLLTGEAPGYLRDPREVSEYLAWLLPSEADWDPRDWEPFVYGLAEAAHPVCLELFASGGRVRAGWVVSDRDASAVRAAAEAVGTAVHPAPDPLLEWAAASPDVSVWAAELTLGREFLYPIRTDFRTDPLEGLILALASAPADEAAVVQVLFSPCRNPWAQGLWNSVTGPDGRPFFADGQRQLAAVRDKCSYPLFAASARLAVLSADGCGPLPSRMLRSLSRFSAGNTLAAVAPAYGDDDGGRADLAEDLLWRRFRRSGMLLNAAELYSLVHPPSREAGGAALERLAARTRRAPPGPGGGLLLGTNPHAGEEAEVRLAQEDRLRHVHVVGGSGTGKSTLLLSSMLQDLEAGRGFALLDPHGDLVDAVLDRLPENRVRDVVLFDPSDTEFPVGFNILRAHSETERSLLASDFVAVFERLSTSWGDQMSAIMGNAALAILESPRGGTLLDLKRFLIERPFRDAVLREVRDPEVAYFWRHEFPLLRGGTQGSLLTRLSAFLRNRTLRNMVSQSGDRLDVARLMDEGKVILAPLPQGLIGRENSWLLGSLLVSKFHQAALSRQAQDSSSRRPFFLYMDEAHDFVTPSIATILSGARKYGLGLVLAHQELGQFPARESGILGAVMANCHTRVCFRLGDGDAEKLASGFSHFDADGLRRLGTGEAVCRTGGSDRDFNLRTVPAPDPPPGHADRRARAVANSRAAYAAPREEVEQALAGLDRSPSPRASAGTAEGGAATPRPEARREPAPPPPAEPAVVADQPVPRPAEPIPAHSPPEPVPEGSPGRGGSAHKALQRAVKMHANGLGLRATVEAMLPGGGSVDVLLEGAGLRVAVEVAERSPVPQEVRNIEKALEDGIREVVVVSGRRAHLDSIRGAAEAAGLGPELNLVTFLETGELGGWFAALGARLASGETEVRGYRVRVTYRPVGPDGAAAGVADVHRAVADRDGNAGSQEGAEPPVLP